MTSLFPFQGLKTQTDLLNEDIIEDAGNYISDLTFLEKEIKKFKASKEREWMIQGELYYEGEHKILSEKRTFIGQGGRLQIADNLPNNLIIDNQYAKLVDQKVNYQLGKPITLESKNDRYVDELKNVFNKKFQRTLKAVGMDSLNMGLGWMYPYYNDRGEFNVKRFPAYQILPFWKDSDKEELDFAVRLYTVTQYEGEKEVEKEKVEVYSVNGVSYYEFFNNRLLPDVTKETSAYVNLTDGENSIALNWDKVPLIPFKFNNKEIPLIKRVKSLQDGINRMISDFENNMQEDSRNTILVLHNYDGQDLGEFRRNLAQFGAVKVRSGDGSKGGLETLQIEVNSENYRSILNIFKKALIENGRGFDAKDERMSSNPNQMNIQSMYADIELDANGIETEYQASFEELLWFINKHLANTGRGNFDNEQVNIIFNRDMLSNEKEIVETIALSTWLSNETRIAMHPYVTDVEEELKRKQAEVKAELDLADGYNETFERINL